MHACSLPSAAARAVAEINCHQWLSYPAPQLILLSHSVSFSSPKPAALTLSQEHCLALPSCQQRPLLKRLGAAVGVLLANCPSHACSLLLPPLAPRKENTRYFYYFKTDQITQWLREEYPAPSSFVAMGSPQTISPENLHVCASSLLHSLV